MEFIEINLNLSNKFECLFNNILDIFIYLFIFLIAVSLTDRVFVFRNLTCSRVVSCRILVSVSLSMHPSWPGIQPSSCRRRPQPWAAFLEPGFQDAILENDHWKLELRRRLGSNSGRRGRFTFSSLSLLTPLNFRGRSVCHRFSSLSLLTPLNFRGRSVRL